MIDVELLVVHAAELVTCAGPAGGLRAPRARELAVLVDGAVAVDGGRIVEVGTSDELLSRFAARTVLDATGRLVSPGLVDPHTHLVHGGSRDQEWEHRVTETPWRGAERGIASTVRATREASSADLLERAHRDLDVMLRHGTTTIEAKTGYGLDRETELRLLDVMVALDHPIEVSPTFLGAHVVPPDYADRREDYVDLVIALLPEARSRAEWCDVWCDPIAFTASEARRILAVASDLGFGVRMHADQTGLAGGVPLAVELGAASVDHLDHASDDDLAVLGGSDTVAVLLPGCTLHLFDTCTRDWPTWAGRIGRSGAVVALSTDYNPGSCPMPSMQTAMGLASRLYRMSAAEIWHAVTLNAAAALRRGDQIGSIEMGKQADLVVWSVPSHTMVMNRFGTNLADIVVKAGSVVVRDGERVRPAT